MLRVFLTLGLATLAACSSGPSVAEKKADIYYSSGTQSLVNGDYTTALDHLLKANELRPENSEVLTNLGMAYYFKGERDLAVKYLTQALEIKEDNSDARTNLASIHFKDGDFNEAERLYKQVLKDLTYDKQARTLFNLGMVELEGRKNTTKAEDYFNRSIKEDENYCPSFFQLGVIQLGRRQFNGALKNFKEAGAGTCYNSPAPHYYQGLALLELGRFDDARVKFDDVETRFKKTNYAAKARSKAVEINSLEIRQRSRDQHASSAKVLESPDF